MKLPGSHEFVELSAGACHYRIDGPGDGTPLLLIHGATVPGWEFERITPMLNRAGFRTLCPDLYGHGYSARPQTAHDYALFERQLAEFLEHTVPGQPVALLGHSLGAVIALRMALAEPARHSALVMAAPMLDFLVNLPGAGLLRIPLLGELIVHGYAVPMLVRRRTRRYRPIEDGRFVRMFREQLQLPGFARSLLSLLRSGALGDQTATYATLGSLATPVLLLRGDDDNIVTAKQFETLGTLAPDARFEVIPETAHAMLLTDPERAAAPILRFLGEHLPS